MLQKFYRDTLGGRYIKSLLAQTPIPIFDAVVDGDNLIEGCYYVYKRYIIQCHTSGILSVPEDDGKDLVPSDTLYPSVFLFPGTGYGYQPARFYVRSIVDFENPKTHGVFRSSTNYYDSETHYHLGRYLRYLYTSTGLNLFPFYNCYSGKYFSDVELQQTSSNDIVVVKTKKQNYKVVAIPILFGRSYSIAIDCPTQVMVRACIHDDIGYTTEETLPHNLQELLSYSGRIYKNLKFSKLEHFRIETDKRTDMLLQKNLYLLIQLPKENDSSIVVLENYNVDTSIQCDSKGVIKPKLSKLSLLNINTHESYAFSDRLIEYLLGNVIDEQEQYAQNISNVQTSLQKYSVDYFRSFLNGKNTKGVWNKDIPNLVMGIVENYSEENMVLDHDGNINKDVEAIIYSKGGSY